MLAVQTRPGRGEGVSRAPVPRALEVLRIGAHTGLCHCLLLTHALSIGQVHGPKQRWGVEVGRNGAGGAYGAAGKVSLPEGVGRTQPSLRAGVAGRRLNMGPALREARPRLTGEAPHTPHLASAKVGR